MDGFIAQARAQDEVRRVCPDGTSTTLEQLGQLDYVEACAHEAMRLKPVAPQNSMQALRDTALGDLHVSAGTIVMAAMRRDAVNERLIPNARAFDPQRWLAEPAGEGSTTGGLSAGAAKRISMPFGAGPRICPGRYLALLEMKLAVAVLLQNFDLQRVGTADGQPPRERLQLAMAPVGLQMRLRERHRGDADPRGPAAGQPLAH